MITGIAIGFVIGWIVFERPVLATDIITATKDKIKSLIEGTAD